MERKAKVGDKVKIVSVHPESIGEYEIGDIFVVTSTGLLKSSDSIPKRDVPETMCLPLTRSICTSSGNLLISFTNAATSSTVLNATITFLIISFSLSLINLLLFVTTLFYHV